jgi:signal peptidase I
MPDDAIQPGSPAPLPSNQIRPGSPGKAEDSVPLTRPPSSARRPATDPPRTPPQPPEIKDSFRETIETIVFVVVLVLMLKTFLAEAFVIPTGSMATTLLGYNSDVTCEKCGFEFPVNVTNWVDPQQRAPEPIRTARCPNCRYVNPVQGVGPVGGP